MPEVPVIDRPAVSARRDPVEPEAPETPARPPVPRVVGTEGEHAPRRDAPRRRMLVRIAALLALVAIGFGVYRWFAGRGAETTDDAQVEGHLIPILARVQGYVQSVDVTDNQTVHAGELLVQLDDRDLEAQLAKAQADVREQQTVSASGGQASAQVAVAQAGLAQARANASHAEADLARMQTLARDGAISQQQLEVAQTTAATARAAVTAAEDQVAAARAGRQGASGKLQSLQAAETQAALQLSYTKIVAPLGGVVSNRAVEAGQLVLPGQQLMTVVPLDDIWVVANYKETQMPRVRVGDPAQIKVDAYPGHVFQGRVESVSPATGAKFSLLPPDNATGNFTKVVQRVPVRIRLVGGADPQRPLRPGMSVRATVRGSR